MYKCIYPYIVHVNEYDRYRCERWEHVSEHWRRLPIR
nr:MAG TPA: hypothetical protein [Caudoviricetes sp.]